jgi:hypothetical protein
MITLIMFLLASIGLTNILVHGSILDHIKVWGKSARQWMHHWEWSKALFSCYECTGFWAGLFCGFFFFWGDWWFILPAGFVGSVTAQTYTDLMYLLRSKIDFEVGDDEQSTTE